MAVAGLIGPCYDQTLNQKLLILPVKLILCSETPPGPSSESEPGRVFCLSVACIFRHHDVIMIRRERTIPGLLRGGTPRLSLC